MKGLLKKDLYLITCRKETLLILLMCAVFMSFSMDSTFLLTYVPMIAMILGIGTVSYDEYDNGYPFLFSLPVDSRTYVGAKFVFCYLLQIIGAVFGFILVAVLNATGIKPADLSDGFSFAASSFGVMMVMCSIMLYVQLRFGSERSRVIMMVIYGLFMVCGVMIARFAERLQPVVSSIVLLLGSVPSYVVLAGLFVICAALCYLLYRMTVRVMDKKEY